MNEHVCPACEVERADYEGRDWRNYPGGAWLPACPHCGSDRAPVPAWQLPALRAYHSVVDEYELEQEKRRENALAEACIEIAAIVADVAGVKEPPIQEDDEGALYAEVDGVRFYRFGAHSRSYYLARQCDECGRWVKRLLSRDDPITSLGSALAGNLSAHDCGSWEGDKNYHAVLTTAYRPSPALSLAEEDLIRALRRVIEERGPA